MTGPASEADVRVYGAGLLARTLGTVQAMLAVAPSGRDADLNILVRAAFEHAVTFAWLAADPNHRFVRWQKEDAISRLAIHRDMQRFGETLLTPALEAELRRQADVPQRKPPSMPDRAEQADKYWGSRLQLPDPPHLASFRGLYTTVYRRGSSRTHATVLGLNDVLRRAGGGQYVVALEASGTQPSLRRPRSCSDSRFSSPRRHSGGRDAQLSTQSSTNSALRRSAEKATMPVLAPSAVSAER